MARTKKSNPSTPSTTVTLEDIFKAVNSLADRVSALEQGAPKTSSSKKSGSGKKSSKSSDFDYDEYRRIATASGAMNQNGTVTKCCRKHIYAAMNGDITEAKCKALCTETKKAKGWI